MRGKGDCVCMNVGGERKRWSYMYTYIVHAWYMYICAKWERSVHVNVQYVCTYPGGGGDDGGGDVGGKEERRRQARGIETRQPHA